MMGLVLFVYYKRDDIRMTIKEFLMKENEPLIKDSNEYKRKGKIK